MPTTFRMILLALALALPTLAFADSDQGKDTAPCAHCAHAHGEKKEACKCAAGENSEGCPHCAGEEGCACPKAGEGNCPHCAKGGDCEDCCGACKGEAAEGGCPHCAGEEGCACPKAGKGNCPHCAKDGEGGCPHCAKAGKAKGKKGCACSDKGERAQKEGSHGAEWTRIAVPELEALQARGAVTVFDANGDELRRKEGTIPGAVLLPTSSSYDLALLPADKERPLVFYCANPRCTAAHTAADRAVQAGYRKVRVLPAGILGWKEAGKPTARLGS